MPRTEESRRDKPTLRCIELSNDTLQYLIDDARQHSLVVVLSELSVDVGQFGNRRSREDTAGDVDHLEIWYENGPGEHNRMIE